jgi:hypothetical protein
MILDNSVIHPTILNNFKTLEERFNLVHDNKYTYEKAIFVNVDTKITITCPVHGDWQQMPKSHLSGNGCKQCFLEKRKKNISTFVEQANTVHANKFDYSKAVYTTTHGKLKIICKECNYEFEQTANSHLRGTGCPKCTNNQRYTTGEFIDKVSKIHSNKYTYSKTEYVKASQKIIVTCPIHGDFKQMASAHMHGQGCGKCKVGGYNKLLPGRLYYLKVTVNNIDYYKIGITNYTIAKRFRTKNDRDKITVLYEKVYQNGVIAADWEKFFKTKYKKYQYQGEKFFDNAGETELFTLDILELFYKERGIHELNSKELPI